MPRLPVPQGDEKNCLSNSSTTTRPGSRLSCQVDFTEALDGLALAVAPDRVADRGPRPNESEGR